MQTLKSLTASSGQCIRLSILKMKQNLNMSSLLSCLQHHYEEKSTPDLCANPTAATQTPNEAPVDFVLSCTELRGKCSHQRYREKQSMMHILSKSCFYVLQKGVLKVLLQISVNVLQEVRPVLRNPDTSDEQILIATQRASIEKREKSKLFSRKAPKVHLLQGNHSIGCSPGAQQNDHEFRLNK